MMIFLKQPWTTFRVRVNGAKMERRLTEMMMQPGYKPLTIKAIKKDSMMINLLTSLMHKESMKSS